ncbi:acetyl/propionyl-CoA carboxylase subuit alpha [Rhodococcus sp. Leaf7]|uniref:acetyl/propionyl/methylcrotonyl-CoA carboxylase subunit alpha n=1 Tax=unclassified Rhodococcus (in: high G+C Gram-positive bacteria) TaxID=192944 RepID=UPI0006FFD7C1|nr:MULTISPECIES: acetyl/propionyl/methylcrotonyl-CoA carboxylase subunit alpha [unclassified Rhodococcus (in: high G+C Gram-positive bacteria)]KQU04788.1 acetyl/propionyl-CoA carboxylase subuit alpha [Rhodococcus sp. Leaf7]KQU40975.1 acetyl/propionyl-CoA carboxylase subuit alpha [Rhodococcus sp. Leaf247]
MTTIDTVLVANRGEIAVRVFRTLRTMGIRSVAVYSDADADALHVRAADTAVRLGPAPARESYLDIDKVIEAALASGADAIHPGYGFLSENAAFAAACEKNGITFIGPPTRAIETMGDKITAKKAVSAFDVPVVPGIAEPGLSDDALVAAAGNIGYPVLIKPSAGGGGKGMHLVERDEDLRPALIRARREAASSFGDDTLFLERFVLRPRHIEVQVMADAHGSVIHLGERECSLQRRHQKVIEEAPSPLLDEATRDRIGAAACATARSVDYVGAGTVEFIVSADAPDDFFFMEMNTRLQVEHPVTEMVTGVDLVELQIRMAAGEHLALRQQDVTLTGHAIEARVYAEDPGNGFLPTGGRVIGLHEPVGDGVRVDSSLSVGTVVGSDYDPMLSKVISYGRDRAEALRILRRALGETAIMGFGTNVDFLSYLLSNPDVVAGELDTELLDRVAPDYAAPTAPDEVAAAAAVYRWCADWPDSAADPWSDRGGWRLGGRRAPTTIVVEDAGRRRTVTIVGTPTDATVAVDGGDERPLTAHVDGDRLTIALGGRRESYSVATEHGSLWLAGARGVWHMTPAAEVDLVDGAESELDESVRSPMPGTVIAVEVADGDHVTAGSVVVVVEAMKMEHALTAPTDGVVELLVARGDQVTVNHVLARVTTSGEEGRS